MPIKFSFMRGGVGFLDGGGKCANYLCFHPRPPLSRYRVSLYPPNLPYRSRREGLAGGIAAQAALWRILRYMGVSLR